LSTNQSDAISNCLSKFLTHRSPKPLDFEATCGIELDSLWQQYAVTRFEFELTCLLSVAT